MALKPCPSCGHMVSDDAATCPSCGHPLRVDKKERDKKAAGIGCLAVAVLIIGFLIWAANEGAKIEKAEKANPTCISDYTKCKDDDDLIEHHETKDGFSMSIACESEAKNLAKYGTPKFSFPPFPRYFKGQLYIVTGRATLLDDDAQFQNGFGAYENVMARCQYDLKTDRAIVELIPK